MPEKRANARAADETRWAAVVRRDPMADGSFYYSVETTGIYCRPSCPARLPRRENVRFHDSCAAAEKAGYRACLRCRPAEVSLSKRHAEAIARVCRKIDDAEEMPSLDELAACAGLSRFHFHRVFKKIMGITPNAYARAQRSRRMGDALKRSRSVTEGIYEAGFNSSGRFYEAAPRALGMTPSAFRTGGAGTLIRFALGSCAFGVLLVAASDRGVCAIFLGDAAQALVRDLKKRFPNASIAPADGPFERELAKVVAFVDDPALGLDLPLDVRGTAFQARVWKALSEIAPGDVSTYADVARRIGMPRGARAVARACAENPVAVAIPCHRVLRGNGSLSGYRWGVERKRALLARERGAREKREQREKRNT